ncbi:glycogen synthase GlgA [Undibacterium sp. TJN25]|uniref:glycogen synthase GlgA n=1 Tax=Undibacterium sp. TJN25 TaxID=3413056 RepID=UPI003BF3B057
MRPRVLLVSSEAVPLVKTGGLADVITALALSLEEQGVEATILLPGYPAALRGASGLRKVADLSDLPGGKGELLQGYMPDTGIPVLLLDTPQFNQRSANPYVDHSGNEFDDNAVCFAALAHAAVKICAGQTRFPVPHIVHSNDWHAALIPALLKAKGLHHIGTVLTIHNLAFQGNYSAELAPELGIPSEMVSEDGMEFWGKISFMKAGIRYADRISTVSETYASEILTPRFGNGMDGVLRQRKDALVATPNGVDLQLWNPGSDTLIAKNYNNDDIRGKVVCKRDLQKRFNLPLQPFARIVALGSRMTHQKMADVVLDALPALLEAHPTMQLAVLGCGDHQYEQKFLELAANYPDRVGVRIGYDEDTAHALHAGADILLHASRFEPFGLTPIYSMLYGTIPVCSRVGGMCDTVVDAGLEGAVDRGATGILFDGESVEDVHAAVSRALELSIQPAVWKRMQTDAMMCDFSWKEPVSRYIRMYAEIAQPEAAELFRASLMPAAANATHIIERRSSENRIA